MNAKVFRTVMLPVDALAPPERNPNSMPDADYAALVANIRSTGFLQPILVRGLEPPRAPTPNDDAVFVDTLLREERDWREIVLEDFLPIVDGEHRWRAAREVGLAEVPCVVGEFDNRTVELLRIGMNRLRGELDLGAVAKTLSELSAGGAELDELLLSGYSADEIDGLLAAMRDDPADLSDVGSVGGPEDEPREDGGDKSGKAWVLEVVMESRKELQAVRKKLNALGRKDLRKGLLKALDEE